MLNNIKKIVISRFFIVGLALLATTLAFGFLDIKQVQAAPGDIHVTVTRQGDGGPVEDAIPEIKCTGGDYTPFVGTARTDSNGEVTGTPNLASGCDVDEETLHVRISASGYVTTNNESGPLQGWYSTSDPNEVAFTNLEFSLKLVVNDQLGTALNSVDFITFNSQDPTVQDPVDSNVYYWADSEAVSAPLSIEKNGYVNFGTTHDGLSITTSQDEQIIISLGNASGICNQAGQTTSISCTGLEFAYKYIEINSEVGSLDTVTLFAGQANVSCVESIGEYYCPVNIFDIAPDKYTASKDGFVTKTFLGGTLIGQRSLNADPQVSLGKITLNSSHKFIIKDELGNSLTLDSATAGASNIACTISVDSVYCPILLADDNTLANGLVGAKDGYVTTVASDVPLAANRTSNADAQSVTTLTTLNGLDFSHKVVVVDELGNALTPTSTTAGLAGISCTISGNSAYCPILLAQDDTVSNGFAVVKNGYKSSIPGLVQLTGNRTSHGEAQKVKTMTSSNGLQFSHKFIIVDELGQALTLDSATAGAASAACTISGSSAYCPVLVADDNTLSNGLVAVKDGYVTTVAANVPLASDRTNNETSQRVTTMTSANGLDFAAKATVKIIDSATVISGATVTAGTALTACAENGSSGVYYCAVPLADTDTTMYAVKTGYANARNNFSDRTAATDAQQAITIQMNTTGGSSGGGGSSNNNTTPPIVTPPPVTPENPKIINIVDRINEEKDMVFAQANPENYFINTGTDSTLGLGSGERGAAVSSFKEAYGRAPVTAADWIDVLNIANGRWPITVNKTIEARAYINFRLVYGRNADMTNSTDVNALKMMGYGVRGSFPRNLNAERAAIARFKTVFGFNPTTARHWNIMRAIAYSGVTQ